MRVLYVEDVISIVKINRGVLAEDRPDIELVTAYNYAEAVKQAESKGPFDLIVSDFEYPGQRTPDEGGMDLYAYAQRNMPQTPFVFASYVLPENIINKMNARGFLIAPTDLYPKDRLIIDVIEEIESTITPRNVGPSALPNAAPQAARPIKDPRPS